MKIYINVEKLLSWEFYEDEEEEDDDPLESIDEVHLYRNTLLRALPSITDPHIRSIMIDDIDWLNSKLVELLANKYK